MRRYFAGTAPSWIIHFQPAPNDLALDDLFVCHAEVVNERAGQVPCLTRLPDRAVCRDRRYESLEASRHADLITISSIRTNSMWQSGMAFTFAATQSRQNSLPSMSRITRHDSS